MKTLIAALILTALTLTALIVAPLFSQPTPSFGDRIVGKVVAKGPDLNVHLLLRRDARSEKF